MLVNSITNFNYGASNKMMAHKSNEAVKQQPARSEGLTSSIYFGSKDNNGNGMRKATMAVLVPLTMLTAASPILTSCDKDESYSESKSWSESNSSATANTSDTTYYISNHGKGCCCDSCCHGRDTVYIDRDHIIYVDTGSYHVTHDTIVKWKHDWQKPIPLDSIAKDLKIFGGDSLTDRQNVVHYEATREWEYGQKFIADMNHLESSKNILVYDREDKDWKGNHTGWGKDVYRIPETDFTIKTYGGKTFKNPKGYFVETYVNEADKKESIFSPDRKLVSRQFLQTRGDSVDVYTYDPETKLYREDGRVSKGYLEKNSILLTDLIASDPELKFARDPEYSTEDHLTNVKVVTVNDEELEMLYLRARDDEYAEQHYGVANN